MKAEKSNSVKTLKLLMSKPQTTSKELVTELGVKLHTAYNLLYNARKTLRLHKVGRGKNAVWKQKIRMQGSPSRDPEGDKIDAMVEKALAKEIIQTHHTDMVNNPPHYTAGGIETIDFIEAKSLGYNLGNVVKYITRADHKGDKHEDLCKARWYLNREIAKLSK
jgi:hypothetical protein